MGESASSCEMLHRWPGLNNDTPAHPYLCVGIPGLEGKKESCGGVGRRRLMPWLCCVWGGQCEGGLVECSVSGALCLPHQPLALLDAGRRLMSPFQQGLCCGGSAQLITEEEPEIPPSSSSPALRQTASPA